MGTGEATVADILGIAIGTVKSRHFRAIKRIRIFLESEGPDPASGDAEESSHAD